MTWNGGRQPRRRRHRRARAGSGTSPKGATGGPFNLFYLLQNTSSHAAAVTVRYLPAGARTAVDHAHYTVPPRSRFTIWVDDAAPGSRPPTSRPRSPRTRTSSSSAPCTSTTAARRSPPATPRRRCRRRRSSGSSPRARPARFFDEYILLANPSTSAADVQIDYLLPDGMVVPKAYAIAPESRRTDPRRRRASVARQRGRLGPAARAERRAVHRRAHHVVGRRRLVRGAQLARARRARGTRWLVVGGRSRRPGALLDLRAARQHLAVPGPGARHAPLRGRRHRDADVRRRRPTAASTSTSARSSRQPTTAASRPSSRASARDPAELVVEWSLYGTPGARPWELGANALATNLSSPLRTLTDRADRPRPAAP